jgi:hypothetical protein
MKRPKKRPKKCPKKRPTKRPIKRRPVKTALAAATAQTADPPGEESLNDMRRRITRRLEIMVSDWRKCPRPACKRLRICAPTNRRCVSPRRPRRVTTPKQDALAMAQLRRALTRRLAEMGEEE